MRLKIGFLIEQLQKWFPKLQAQIKSQATELEQKFAEPALEELPAETLSQLRGNIEGLLIPQSHQDAMEVQLSKALATWQKIEDVPNSLVILASPVDKIRNIINTMILSWEQKSIWQIQSLSWEIRPEDYSSIISKLQQEINLSPENVDFQTKNGNLSNYQNIIIIPDLSYCFLRCVDGLNAIEYIQNMVVKDRSTFWLIGCNSWAWEYLNIACQTGSYFEQTYFLPRLNRKEIKSWLYPAFQSIDFDYHESKIQDDNSYLDESEQENWNSKAEKKYYDGLADISLGISSVAAQLWLDSLGLKKRQNEQEEQNNLESTENDVNTIYLKSAKLPNLPELTKDDLYLLFSLCLHSTIDLPALALSLGEPESKIKAQIQILTRWGIIEQKKEMLMLNPAYYPRIKRHLANNHFLLVGD